MKSKEISEPIVKIFTAGSLKGALASIVQAFSLESAIRIELYPGPSGFLRERIEKKDMADLFISADHSHPQRFLDRGLAGQTAVFARISLCLFGRVEPVENLDDIIDPMTAPDLRLGTSTPKDDPGGDYAFEVFKRLDRIRPGLYQILSGKSLQLVGGRHALQNVTDKHPVADLFLKK